LNKPLLVAIFSKRYVMKKWLVLLLCSGMTLMVYGNAAMPGIWQTGHGGRFIPLFKPDSLHLGKIQMQKELVLINLYKGYAAVKGTYWMYNQTDQPVTMRVGYPINGNYSNELVQNVMFNDLHRLTVLLNDQPVTVAKAGEGYDLLLQQADQLHADNWYYFSCTFAPKQLTKITVYFLTNNNDAILRRGYAKEPGNAFAYILESGRAWAGKIEEGRVLIALNDGLALKDMKGIYPPERLTGDDTHLQFAFSGLEPDSSDNILLWYNTGEHAAFNFDTVQDHAKHYFNLLDQFPVAAFNALNPAPVSQEDFTPHDSSMTWFWVILIGIAVVGIAVVVLVVYFIYRIFRKKKSKQSSA